ncbi:MAG: glutathione peroxidase [Armatimonadetes bacterium]|nr:glutathione peroxidase [Armatimonadota bacterium]
MSFLLSLLGLARQEQDFSAVQKFNSLHEFQMRDIDGHDKSLADYKGKIVLVVNVASKCGLTPQYEALESLYEKYKDKGFVILGFPCNDFNGQEPGTEADIKAFCSAKYNVTFPMFSKIHVKGPEADNLYKWLVWKTGGKDIEWNFGKFLIDREGQIVSRFNPKVTPGSDEVVAAVEKSLGQ